MNVNGGNNTNPSHHNHNHYTEDHGVNEMHLLEVQSKICHCEKGKGGYWVNLDLCLTFLELNRTYWKNH